MVILNPIRCEGCGQGLQPENIGITTNSEGDLVRVCGFCGDEVTIE